MHNKYILLVLLVILSCIAASAVAETVPVSTTEAVTPPADMSDEALASYIFGRLKPLLQDEGYSVSQGCNETGCSVVVQ